MTIREIELVSFRNHAAISVRFAKGVNVIWGENGSGKTALLEALYTLSYGKSFRTGQPLEMLRKGDDFFRIAGSFEHAQETETLQISQTANGRRRILINGQQVGGPSLLVGRNPVVLLSPEEQVVTKGSPRERRQFFDRMFAVMSPAYLQDLICYNRCLRQRGAALQKVREQRSVTAAVTAWDEPLAGSGQALWKGRQALLSHFTELLKQFCAEYGGAVYLEVTHVPGGDVSEDGFRKDLQRSLKKDLALGRTGVGPHLDQFDFAFNQRDLRKLGSQGEHKLALILLKRAEYEAIAAATGKQPVLLLDDLFAKLDFERSERVLNMLAGRIQTVITSTDLVDLERHGIDLTRPGNRSLHLTRNTACKA